MKKIIIIITVLLFIAAGTYGGYYCWKTPSARNTVFIAFTKIMCNIKKGSPKACLHIAEKYFRGDLGDLGSVDNYQKSLYYSEKACKLGLLKGCNLAAELSFNSIYELKNDEKAYKYSEKACKEYGSACKIQALTTKNPDETYRLLGEACKLDEPESCAIFGDVLLRKRNFREAATFYKKSCDLGNDIGCYKYAGMLFKGKGIEKSITESVKIFKDLCNKNVDYCNTPGWYLYGQKLDETALEFFNKGCNDMEPLCCFNLATIMLLNGKNEKAIQAYDKGCISTKNYYAKDVNCMAKEIFDSKTKTSKIEEMRLVSVFEKGCEKNIDGEACIILALHHYKFSNKENAVKTFHEKGIEAFNKTCDTDNPAFCRSKDIYLEFFKNAETLIKKPVKEVKEQK